MSLMFRTLHNLKAGIKLCASINKHPIIIIIRFMTKKMKYLNVAEKNDAAKNIALHLSRGTSVRREGLSQYNKIYEFEAEVLGQRCEMVMTSVSGHLLALEFVGTYKHWQGCSPLALFDAPVYKYCPPNYENIKKTLEREVRSCQGLIIWTDCDREGENIGFEIIEVCRAVKPDLQVHRAKFSEITAASVRRALGSLSPPDARVSAAVDVRSELDLRIGAAFTRFQTLRLTRVFPAALARRLLSYGSCQFPTLGFVVERYNAIRNFVAEPFWKIKLSHTVDELTVEFAWSRGRVFDCAAGGALLACCEDAGRAAVRDVTTRPRTKPRPLPLDTIELEKLSSRKLKISAKETMRIAEKLYTSGLISYPRTETNMFPPSLALRPLLELQAGDARWGDFARGLLGGEPAPRAGRKTDHAHPPIHPTKHADNLTGNEARVYELVVRSFLATCARDAQGVETTATVELGGERFTAAGLVITERNYLDVYPYDSWSAKQIHQYQTGSSFVPSELRLAQSATAPPALLTEADLIALMDKHGIGTDATHAEHIETIKKREYVGVAAGRLLPSPLGLGLVEGYTAMQLEMSRPRLRAALEADLQAVCRGDKQPGDVLAHQLAAYKRVYTVAAAQAQRLDEALAGTLQAAPAPPPPASEEAEPRDQAVMKCPSCGSTMSLRRAAGAGAARLYVGCAGYPACRRALWLPPLVKDAALTGDACPECGPDYKLLRLEWSNNSVRHLYPAGHRACLAGCDPRLLDILGVRAAAPPPPRPATTRTAARPTNTVTVTDRASNPFSTARHVPAVPRRPAPPAPAPAPVAPGADSGADDNSVVCGCQLPALLLTVRKQNANCGKKFYKCAVGKDNGGCDFFLWAPDGAGAGAGADSGRGSWGASDASSQGSGAAGAAQRGWGARGPAGGAGGEDVRCDCGQPCKRLTVQKEGANRGRQFFGCARDVAERCKYFQWADDAPPPPAHGGEWGDSGYSGGSGGYGRGRGRGAGAGRGGGGRRCGLCRQPGHTRGRCPQAAAD